MVLVATAQGSISKFKQLVNVIKAGKAHYVFTLLKYCIDTEQLGTSILRHCPGLNAIPQERKEKPLHSVLFTSTFRLLPCSMFIATGISILSPNL